MNDTIKCWLLSKIEGFTAFMLIAGLATFAAPIWLIDGYDTMPEVQQKIASDLALKNIFTLNIFEKITWSVMLITAIIIGIKIAKYTYNYYDEIVSRSFLWRNSNVGIFDSQLKYAIGMFFQAGFIVHLFLMLIWYWTKAYIVC